MSTKFKYNFNGATEEIPLVEGKPACKRLAIYHNGKTCYTPLVAPDDKTASAVHLTCGDTTYALCTNPVKYFAQYCTMYLPFDTSVTQDYGGNTWVTSGSPVIGTTYAFYGKALQLNGSRSMRTSDNSLFSLGGQNFTIDCWAYVKSSGDVYSRIFEFGPDAKRRLCLTRSNSSNIRYTVNIDFPDDGYVGIRDAKNTLNELHHYAIVYVHATHTHYYFIDGILQGTCVAQLPRVTDGFFRIARKYDGGCMPTGAIDQFRVYDGVALWTDNFTPPTAADYDALTLALDSGSKSESSSKKSAVIEEPEEDIQGVMPTSTDSLKANLFSINGMSAYTDLLNESISGNSSISSISPTVAFAYSNAYALWGLSLPQL